MHTDGLVLVPLNWKKHNSFLLASRIKRQLLSSLSVVSRLVSSSAWFDQNRNDGRLVALPKPR